MGRKETQVSSDENGKPHITVQHAVLSDKDKARVTKEWNDTLIALGQAVNGWADVENALAKLLGALLRNDQAGLIIYNSPTNAETRIKIVDRVLMHSIHMQYHAKALKQCWMKVLPAIHSAKDTRNKIVHWNTFEHWTSNGKCFVRHAELHSDFFADNRELIEYFTSQNPFTKLPPMLSRGGKQQLPGMSANDIQLAAKNFTRISRMADAFANCMKLIGRNNSWNFSHERVLRLAAKLEIDNLKIGALKPEG